MSHCCLTLGHGSPGSSRTTHERQEDKESNISIDLSLSNHYRLRQPWARCEIRKTIHHQCRFDCRAGFLVAGQDSPDLQPTGSTVPCPCDRSSQEGSPNLVVSVLLPRLSATTSCTRRGNQHARSAEPSGSQTARTVDCPPSDNLRARSLQSAEPVDRLDPLDTPKTVSSE